VAEVFSGFVVGYAFSLLFTAVAAVMVIEARSRVPYLAKAIAPNISAVQLAVPISLVAFLVWTLVGLLLGLAYRAARLNLTGGGLGSPNWPFTLAVLMATVAFLAVVYYAWRRLPWRVLLTAGAFAGMFGWGMPHLAELGL
jgi:heme/copper-type cytochrome/quinol oxidase subunit 4